MLRAGHDRNRLRFAGRLVVILRPSITVTPDFAPGYCSVCGEPRHVARLTVRGWAFDALVCPGCLRAAADRVEGSTIGEPFDLSPGGDRRPVPREHPGTIDLG